MACLQILIPWTPVGMALKRRAGHKEDPEAGHFAFCILHYTFLILHFTNFTFFLHLVSLIFLHFTFFLYILHLH